MLTKDMKLICQQKKGSWFVTALTIVGNYYFLVLVPKSELPQSNMGHDFENAGKKIS